MIKNIGIEVLTSKPFLLWLQSKIGFGYILSEFIQDFQAPYLPSKFNFSIHSINLNLSTLKKKHVIINYTLVI